MVDLSSLLFGRIRILTIFISVCMMGAGVIVYSSSVNRVGRSLSENTDVPKPNITDSPAESEFIAKQDDKDLRFDEVSVPKADMSYCRNLHKVKLISTYQKKSDDPAFFELIRFGDKAIPCLIERITDTQMMRDPLSAPGPRDFRIGDAAVFSLLVINNMNWIPDQMLPAEFASKWPEMGIFAYFEAVEDPANRVFVRNWWRRWWLEKQSSAKPR